MDQVQVKTREAQFCRVISAISNKREDECVADFDMLDNGRIAPDAFISTLQDKYGDKNMSITVTVMNMFGD